MTTPSAQHAGDTPPERAEQSRWGIRLRELAPATTAPALEPLDWRPKPTFWQRVRHGTAVPLAAAAAVFIAIVLISIVTVWMRPHSIEPDPTAPETAALSSKAGPAGTPSADGKGAGTAAPGDSKTGNLGSDLTATGTLYVHIVGEVQQPGVYELKPGSRALAAIDAAGGATEGAVLSGLNLARPLSDGEQLVVPNAENIQTASVSAVGGASSDGNAGNGSLVSLNTADQSALETLPRVGPALAQRIIDWRTANGSFTSVEQLLNVSGIGQRTFEQLSALVTL